MPGTLAMRSWQVLSPQGPQPFLNIKRVGQAIPGFQTFFLKSSVDFFFYSQNFRL